MRKALFATMALALTTFAAPAFACGGNQCEPDPTFGGRFVELELAGMNFGEGLAGAEASGDETETVAGVLKTSTLKLTGNIFGADDDCVDGECRQFGGSFEIDGSEHILTEAGAVASGSGSALAGVANASQAGLGLAGTIRIGRPDQE
jgi:hypothetical protein